MNRKLTVLTILGGFIILLVTMALAPPADAAYESSLKAYWKLDEASGQTTAMDSSGNGTNSWYFAGSPSQNQAGKYGSSYYFDGGSGINFGNHANLQPNTPFTISAWFKNRTGDYLDGYQRIYSKEYQVLLGSGGTSAMCGATTGSWSCGVTTTRPTLDTWHNVTMTFSGSSLKLYMDGALVPNSYPPNYGTREPTSVYTGYTYSASLGYGADTSGQFFRGYIDDVGYWNAAKSDADVYSVYVNGIHPNDVPSRSAEIASYLTGTGLSLTPVELQAIAAAAINDPGGTVTPITSTMNHYEPVLSGSSGSYYYDFSSFTDLSASSWAWGTGPGDLANYSSLNDWYLKAVTGSFLTADGDALYTAGEAWIMKTGGLTDEQGGGGAPEIPAGVALPLLAMLGSAMILLKKRFFGVK